ncbi:transmembrane protein 132C [Petromyzon marinus]|uniref:Transmembrane protein 132C n=1 Tax=Petromyzon marinus TaxID=7757 RepID=A0AAJ7WMJ6_PETMA|nr:transmembrane protein 132C [Petromyzon marinus]
MMMMTLGTAVGGGGGGTMPPGRELCRRRSRRCRRCCCCSRSCVRATAALHVLLLLLARVAMSLDNEHLYSPLLYLPARYELLHTETSYLLKRVNQEIATNANLTSHSQPFVILKANRPPIMNVSFGPFSASKPVTIDLLRTRNSFQPDSIGPRSSWQLQPFLTEEIMFSDRPKAQVMFYITGRDWLDPDSMRDLPCIRLHVFQDAQEVRSSCQLSGTLAMCLAEVVLPSRWFWPPSPLLTYAEVELYCAMQWGGECEKEDNKEVHAWKAQELSVLLQNLRWVGKLVLYRAPDLPPTREVKLDNDVAILLPMRPLRPENVISIPICLLPNSTVDRFTIWAKGKNGLGLLSVLPINPSQWEINSEIINSGKLSVATMNILRKESSIPDNTVDRREVALLEVELENGTAPLRHLLWHVSYNGQDSHPESERLSTEIAVSQRDIRALVPLPMAEELLNTAVLTGRTVALPLRVLVVEESGLVTDVSEEAQCYSLDEDVLKVSAGCEYAYVNGKERQGSTRARVHVSYEHMRASLDLTVWMPKLPLQIQISDTVLNPIKNWRVPNIGKRGPILETVEDDNEPKGRGCFLQSQHAQLRVWAQFCAANPDKLGQLTTMLGPDWTADVTPLVLDHMAVEDTSIAQLHEGKVLIGREPGTTAIQVLSPLSDSILGERAVTVSEEKVSVSGLHVTLLSGLSLSLRASSSEPSVVVASTTGLSIFTASKQEAILMIWLQYSDDTVVPLDVFSPREYLLTVSSLDQKVVSVTVPEGDAWPQIVAEGQGEGGLIRLELMICEACQKTRRRTTVVAAVADVHVRFSRPEESGYSGNEQSTESTKEGGDIIDEGSLTLKDIIPNGLGTTTEAGVGVKSTAGTNKNQIMIVPIGMDISRPSAYTDIPTATDSERVDEELQAQNTPGLSDLQIGMYVLLSVFCLAILVFLINCIVFTVRYKRKQSPQSQDEILTHSHEWIELTNPNADTTVQPQDSSAAVPKQGSCLVREGRRGRGVLKDKVSTASTSSGGGGGGTGRGRLQGRIRRQERQSDRMLVKGEPAVSSPTTQRKRVTFTTFMTVHSPVHGAEAYSSLPPTKEREIEWICLDTGYREPENLRNYIQSLTDTL